MTAPLTKAEIERVLTKRIRELEDELERQRRLRIKAEIRLTKARFTQSELAYLHNGLHKTRGEVWLFDGCPDKVCTLLRERVKASEREATT